MAPASGLKTVVPDGASAELGADPSVTPHLKLAQNLSKVDIQERLGPSGGSLIDQIAAEPPPATQASTMVPGLTVVANSTVDHHDIAHAQFLTTIAVAITRKEPYEQDPTIARYLSAHPECLAEAREIAARLPAETKQFEEILQSAQSPEQLTKFLDALPPKDLAAVVKLSQESFLKDLPSDERSRAAAVLAAQATIKREFVEIISLKRLAGEISAEKAGLLAAETAPNQERLAECEQRMASLLKIAQERFGNDAAITTHIRAAAQRAEDFALAQRVTEEVSTLARRAGAYEGLQAGTALARRVNEYLEKHQDLFDRNPDLEKVLRARVEEQKEQGRQAHRELDQRANDLHDEFHRFFGARNEKISGLLVDLNSERMLLLRELYSEKFPNLHLREEITQRCSEPQQLLALYARQNSGFVHRGLTADQYASLFPIHNTVVVTEALCSDDRAARLAVELNDALVTSPQPTLEIARRLQEEPEHAPAAATTKHAEIFGVSVVEAVAAKLHRIAEKDLKSRLPTSAEQRDALGLMIVGQSAHQAPVAPEVLAQFAVADAQASAERLGILRAKETVDAERVKATQTKQAATNQILSELYITHPELSDVVSSRAAEAETTARAKEIARIGGAMAYEVGLVRNEESTAVRSQRESELERYMAAHQEFQAAHPELSAAIATHLKRCDASGVSDYAGANNGVDKLATTLWGPGTDEDGAYEAVSGRSPEVQALMRRLYLQKYGTSIDAAYQGDFSGAQRDKVAALLIGDTVASNAAAFHSEMGAFFGPIQDTLRRLAREATTDDERARFKNIFAQRYAAEYVERDSEGRAIGKPATTLDDALQRTVSLEDKKILLSLANGNHDTGDALIVKQQLGSATRDPEIAEVAKTLDGMREQNTGLLDTARINRVLQEFSAVAKGRDFKQELSKLSGADAQWVKSMIPDGRDQLMMEVESRLAKLRHGIEDGFFSANKELINEALSAPAALRAQADRQERQYGKISSETAQQLQHWQEINQKIAASYQAAGGDEVEARLKRRLSAHNARISTALLEQARLTVGQQLWDSMEGVGTSGNPAILLKDASKQGMEGIRADFASFSGSTQALEEWFDGDLSGHERFDAKLYAKGRPETVEEMLAAAKARLDHEQSGIADNLGFGQDMRKEYARLQKAVQSGEQQAQLNAIYGNFVTQADGYRMTKDMVTDMVANGASTTIIVVGSGVAIVASGGTATIILVGVGTGVAAGGTRATIKYAGKGAGYSQSEMVADGVQTVIDSAMPAVLGKLLPAGTAAGRAILAQGGERMVLKGAVDVTRAEGQQLSRDVLLQYGQRHFGARVLSNAVDGTIIGAAATPVQAGLMTVVDERTYQRGVGGVFTALGSNTLHALPQSLGYGLVFSAGFGAFAKAPHIQAMEPLSVKATTKILGKEVGGLRLSRQVPFDEIPTVRGGAPRDPHTPQGREYLHTQIEKNGVLTRKDIEVANLDTELIGQSKSKRFIEQLRSSGTVEGSVIKELEGKLATRGSLSKFDIATQKGTLPKSQPIVTAKEIDTHLTAVEKQVDLLKKGLDNAKRQEDLTAISRYKEALEIATTRAEALEALKMRSDKMIAEAPQLIEEATVAAKNLAAAKNDPTLLNADSEALPAHSTTTDKTVEPPAEVGPLSTKQSRDVARARADLDAAQRAGDPVRIKMARQGLDRANDALIEVTVPRSSKVPVSSKITSATTGEPSAPAGTVVLNDAPIATRPTAVDAAPAAPTVAAPDSVAVRAPSAAEARIQNKISQLQTEIKIAEKWIEINAADVRSGKINEVQAARETEGARNHLRTLRNQEQELLGELTQQRKIEELQEASQQASRERAERIRAEVAEQEAGRKALLDRFLQESATARAAPPELTGPSVADAGSRGGVSESVAPADRPLPVDRSDGSRSPSSGNGGGSTPSGDGEANMVLEKRTIATVERLKTVDGGTVERVVYHDEFVPVETIGATKPSPALERMLSEIANIPATPVEVNVSHVVQSESPQAAPNKPKLSSEELARLSANVEKARVSLDNAQRSGERSAIDAARRKLDLAQDALIDGQRGKTPQLAEPSAQARGLDPLVESQAATSATPKTKEEILAPLKQEVDAAKVRLKAAEESGDAVMHDDAYAAYEGAQDALLKAQNEIYAAELEATIFQLEKQASERSSASLEQKIAETRQALAEHEAMMKELYGAPRQETEIATPADDSYSPDISSTEDGGMSGGSGDFESGGGGTATLQETKVVTEQDVDLLLATLDDTTTQVAVEEPKPATEPEVQTKPVETQQLQTEQPQTEPAQKAEPTPAPVETTPASQNAVADSPPQLAPEVQPAPQPAPRTSVATQPKLAPQPAPEVAVATQTRTAVKPQLAASPTVDPHAAPLMVPSGARMPYRSPRVEPEAVVAPEEALPIRRRRVLASQNGEGYVDPEVFQKKRDEPSIEEVLREASEVRRLELRRGMRRLFLVQAHGELRTEQEKAEAGLLGYIVRNRID